MNKFLHKSSPRRAALATSLCYALTVLMSLEALHPSCCQWLGMTPEQSFALSALIATLSMFCGTWIWTRRTQLGDNDIGSANLE